MFLKRQGLKQTLKAVFSHRILYFTALALAALTGFLFGKKITLKPTTPSIIVDTSEIDCGCDEILKNCEVSAAAAAAETDTTKLSPTPESESIPTENTEKSIPQSDPALGSFMASKNGTKYYPLDCKSAERIKEENRVYYPSEAAAQADGKEKAANCP